MIRLSIIITAATVLAGVSQAVENPFTEGFAADNSNWRNFNATADLNYVPGGSYNGSSYASGSFNFVNSVLDDTPVVIRGQDEFNHSNGMFDGSWINAGVNQFMAFVRHDAPETLTYFTRFSMPNNFPGATAISFIPVEPNTWTPIMIEISPTSPNFIVYEGTDYDTLFQNIGHIQVGISVGESLAGLDQDITFDIDDISITPAPATLLALGGLAAIRRRRS